MVFLYSIFQKSPIHIDQSSKGIRANFIHSSFPCLESHSSYIKNQSQTEFAVSTMVSYMWVLFCSIDNCSKTNVYKKKKFWASLFAEYATYTKEEEKVVVYISGGIGWLAGCWKHKMHIWPYAFIPAPCFQSHCMIGNGLQLILWQRQ